MIGGLLREHPLQVLAHPVRVLRGPDPVRPPAHAGVVEQLQRPGDPQDLAAELGAQPADEEPPAVGGAVVGVHRVQPGRPVGPRGVGLVLGPRVRKLQKTLAACSPPTVTTWPRPDRSRSTSAATAQVAPHAAWTYRR